MSRPEPPAYELSWEFFRATGPGGQHRNKVATGVRLTHLPTGITVCATERRSQVRNREAALERLVAKLSLLDQKPKPRKPTRPSAAARRRRMDQKRAQARKKQTRQAPRHDEG